MIDVAEKKMNKTDLAELFWKRVNEYNLHDRA